VKKKNDRRDVHAVQYMIKLNTISIKSMYRYKYRSPPQITKHRIGRKITEILTNEIVGRDHDTKDQAVLYHSANLNHKFDF